MRVVSIPFCFHPDPMGGTEVYVASLAKELLARDVEVIIAAPDNATRRYAHDGICVRRFAVRQQVADLRELYGEGDELAAQEFAKILDEEQPDIVHLHAFTRGVSLRLVRAAKARGIPVLFTYHTPTVSCQRGTMMRWGKEPCDGLMDARACAACTLHGLGLPRTAARVLTRFSLSASNGERARVRCSKLYPALPRQVSTALRMRELVELRHETTRALFNEVDHIVAVCQWVKDVLLCNGVPEEKITLCRQGIAAKAEAESQKSEVRSQRAEGTCSDLRPPASDFRICFFGRLDPTKGVDVLLKAVRSIPDVRLRLDIYGVAQGAGGKNYEQTLRRMAEGDKRIAFRAPVSASEVIPAIGRYDLLAVPSQWLETGPLVVLESFAAGVPVIGSNLGGIAELVRDGVDGILVTPDSFRAWAAASAKLSGEPELLKQLRSEIQPARTMSKVAGEMLALYDSVLNLRRVAMRS